MATIESATEIRPFEVEVPEEDLVDLRRRIAATRWPERETVADETQGVQLATMQALVRYWGNEYNFRRFEALPQPHLLQRSRQRRPLRRVGRAGALRRRGASRIQVTTKHERR
jgi:hypothetical protein